MDGFALPEALAHVEISTFQSQGPKMVDFWQHEAPWRLENSTLKKSSSKHGCFVASGGNSTAIKRYFANQGPNMYGFGPPEAPSQLETSIERGQGPPTLFFFALKVPAGLETMPCTLNLKT